MAGQAGEPPSPNHDPEAFVSELLESLSPRRRHVVFLLGAGASKAAGLPDLQGLAGEVGEKLANEPNLKADYERLLAGRNIEEVLTRLRAISSLLQGSEEKVDFLDAARSMDLDSKICSAISVTISQQAAALEHHRAFAAWISRTEHDLPVEVFTINYDTLIERGLEAAGVPYFDGFVGTYEGRFRADLVDGIHQAGIDRFAAPPGWVRVWKLHGSVSWHLAQEDGAILRASGSVPEGEALAIYPSIEKYEQSRRVPFLTLFDRFRRALETPETLAITCGYSFRDEHINEVLFDAAERFPRSEVVALMHSDLPEEVERRAGGTPNLVAIGARKAVIGTHTAEWRAPPQAQHYWTNDEFGLGDFSVLTTVLSGARGGSEEAGA